MSSATTTTWEDRGSKSLPAELPAARSSQGWSFYLVLMALLVPVLHPAGPSQIAMLDALNAIAIVVFTFGLFASRARVEFPLIVPIALASIGSLIAVTNAESYAKATMTMVQDAYLYLWFVLLVAILKDRGDLKLLRVTWMWSANIAGAIGFGMLLTDGTTKFTQIFGARGNRAFGLFDGPNALADYLMMSLFVVITLNGQIPRVVVWGSFTFQFLALIATKSNGAMLSFLIGMGLWLVVRAFTRARSFVPVAGAVLLLGGLLLFGAWGATLGGVSGFREFQKKSFLGRFEQSAEGRGHIWERLAKTYARAPLGIGPGNSSEQRLSVGERERKKSARSKEAHSDYLGYLVERGPLALFALILLVVMPFMAAATGYARNPDPAWKRGIGGALLAAFVGGLIATSLHSFFMEKLHFRHYWAFLAMIYAVAAAPLVRRPRRSAAGTNHRTA